MSGLADLVSQLCPDGVEYFTLGELGSLYSGLTGKSKPDFTDGNTRYVTYMNVFSNPVTDVTPDDHVTVNPGERQNVVRAGDVLFTMSSETAAEVGMSSVVTTEPPEPLHLNSFCFGWRPNDTTAIDPAFAKHLFRSSPVRRQIVATANGVTRINISRKPFLAARIPVPPLEVQRSIVAALDPMEQLLESLTAEARERRRQLAAYRNGLLTFGDDVARSTLGQVSSKVFSGGTPLSSKREYYGGGIPWLRTQEVNYADIHSTAETITQAGLENSSARWVQPNSVIIAMSGAGVTRGRAAVNRVSVTTNQHCLNLEIDPAIAHYRYVYHWVSHRYDDLRSYGQGNRSDLNAGIVKAYGIPLPALNEQERIARVLDTFDALIHDPASGLGAEIDARLRQFAYYRDKLLTFAEKPRQDAA